MSRVGERPIEVPSGVKVRLEGNSVVVEGPLGTMSMDVQPDMEIKRDNGVLLVERPSDERQHRQLHGLTRTLIANMVQGVTNGFQKSLELRGMGYRAELQNRQLMLYVGFSQPVEFEVPEGIDFEVESFTASSQNEYIAARIAVKGIDKQQVGNVAATLRSVRAVEPYKGKGLRYLDEIIRLKPGKQAKAGEA